MTLSYRLDADLEYTESAMREGSRRPDPTTPYINASVIVQEMIERLQRIAQVIHVLRLPSVGVGLISLAAIAVIIFTSESQEGDRFLMPSIVAFIWALSTYSFIGIFRSIPEKASKSATFFSRVKRSIHRGWYWFMGVVFIGTTAAVIFVTYRLVSLWLGDYATK